MTITVAILISADQPFQAPDRTRRLTITAVVCKSIAISTLSPPQTR
jgi:hypothetical protein